jgi:hypothetical protein
MAVVPLGDGLYSVRSESGSSYVADLLERRCSCPDNTYRGQRCKHLRRVAIEITQRRVPAPGQELRECAVCGEEAFLRPEEPPLCADCRYSPGTSVRDRETGDLLVVVEQSGARAEEVGLVDAGGHTVADHPTNEGYPADDPVVYCVYPFSGGSDRSFEELRRYAFPHSRLGPASTDAQTGR